MIPYLLICAKVRAHLRELIENLPWHNDKVSRHLALYMRFHEKNLRQYAYVHTLFARSLRQAQV